MPGQRIRSIDILRGIIMILMAIDHVRVYSGIPAGGPDLAVFFTRWVTHFCVSGFVFFAGTSAFLYGQKLNDKARLSRYLFVRGIGLILLELTLVRFCWSFHLDLGFMLAGVLWMLGWCMVLMAAIIWLPLRAVWIIGLFIIAFQQVFKLVPASWSWWNFIYPVSETVPGDINVLYVIVPWIGVMMTGYGFGKLLTNNPTQRDKLCLWIGGAAIIVYFVAGSILAMQAKGGQPFLYKLLGQQKYPASQLFLLMTLGPLIALIPLAEKVTGRLPDILKKFGKVPLFYYLLHIPLIHLSALAVNAIIYHDPHSEWYATAPFSQVPKDFRWHLGLLYLVYAVDLILLYFCCRWYIDYKYKHSHAK